MKKSIIALVIAGLPLAASAEVILYGQIKSSVTVGQVKIKGDAGSETSSTATSINDNTSRIGFKGSENLGGDLKAIWQVEQKTAITGGSQGFATRDSFIGLQGNFGKIRAGKLSNMLNEMDTIDPWMYKTNAAGLGTLPVPAIVTPPYATTARISADSNSTCLTHRATTAILQTNTRTPNRPKTNTPAA